MGARYLVLNPLTGVFVPQDLGGAVFTSVIRLGPHKASTEAGGNFVVTVVDESEGLFRVSLPSSHALVAGGYWFEVDVELGGEKSTIVSGTLTVKESLL